MLPASLMTGILNKNCQELLGIHRLVPRCITDFTEAENKGLNDTRRCLVIFGGSTGVKLLSCTWEFDLEVERWRQIQHDGTLLPTRWNYGSEKHFLHELHPSLSSY
jgi:hypothetical protein